MDNFINPLADRWAEFASARANFVKSIHTIEKPTVCLHNLSGVCLLIIFTLRTENQRHTEDACKVSDFY